MSPDGSVKPPPEEKLLTLIRGKGAQAQAPPVSPPSSQPPPAAGLIRTGRISELPSRLRALPWPRLAVTGLGALLGLEVVWLIAQVVWPIPEVALPVVRPGGADAPLSDTPPAQAIPSLASSVSGPLFAPAPSAASLTSGSSPPSETAKLLAVRLTLMGTVSGDPAQAIIADSQTQKTYFVSVGQPVVEGAVVEQVLDHRVILTLDGEKIELTL